MKKRILSTLLTLAMIFAFIPTFALPVSAADVTVNGLTYTLSDDRTATVTGCEATETSIEIPASITYGSVNYAVTAIGNKAFYNSASIETVAFAAKSKLTTIGTSAFHGTAITSIEIPASVKSLGDYSLYGCSSLKTVAFAANSQLMTIGIWAFSKIPITSIEIPASVTDIGNYAFCKCTSLKTVVFGKNSILKTIGECAFIQTAITSIEIPAGVTIIDYSSFNECTSLKTVKFGKNSKLKTIGNWTFFKTAITSIEIPASVTTLGNCAFYECTSLKIITFGENSQLETIGDHAFYNTSIASIDIPTNVTSIDTFAFRDCSYLKTVKFAANSKLTTIGKRAFDYCPSDMRVYYTYGSAAERVLRNFFGDAFFSIGKITTAPTMLPIATADGSATLSWTTVGNATKYRVQRKTGSGAWSTIAYPTKTSYLDKNVTNGTTYSYRVLAYVNEAWGDTSNTATVTPTSTANAPVITAKNGNGSVTLSWNAISKATKYRIQRKTGSGAWSSIAYPTATSYTDTTVTNGAAYSYRVLAYVNGAWGGTSNAVTVTPTSATTAPVITAKNGNGSVTLSWNAISKATKYRIQRKTGSGAWSSIAYPTATSYTDTTVTNGTAYSYRVLAYVNGAWGAVSNSVNAVPSASITTPTLKATVNGTTVSLTWQAVKGATKYRIQRMKSGEVWSSISYPTTTGFVDSSVIHGAKYSYRVLAYVDGKWQAASVAVTVTV